MTNIKFKSVAKQPGEQKIKEYMKDQNRPYNLQTLIDNLHGVVGKTMAQKIVDKLAENGTLTCKEFGKTKIYWNNQVCFLSHFRKLYNFLRTDSLFLV